MTAPGTARAAYRVSGLDCPDCARTVDKSVGYIDGVVSASLSFASGVLVVDYDPEHDPRTEVLRLVRRMDYGIEPQESREASVGGLTGVPRAHIIAVAGSGALITLGWLLGRLAGSGAPVTVAVLVLASLIGGNQIYRRAVESARAGSLDMNVLMTIAVAGALAIGEYSEAAMVVFLFSVGGLLEARALARTRQSVRDLMSLSPEIAHVLRDGAGVDVPASSLSPGDVVVVRPGERVPADGMIERGSSAIDESPITGESVPVEKEPGAPVWAGSLNTTGALTVIVETYLGDTTLARIISLVEEAQAGQAPFQRLVDRFTRAYTPAVVALAVAVALVPPLVGVALGGAWDFHTWFYRALVLLVVSCPCALVIATPVSVVSAITRATRDGVLVKGGAFLEMAPRVRAVAFDKTGTLTAGRPEVTSVVSLDGHDAATVLESAAALESVSSHPIARAVVRAHDGAEDPSPGRLHSVHETPGQGITGVLDGVELLVGRPSFARESGVTGQRLDQEIARCEADGETVIVTARLGAEPAPLGVIGVSDAVRHDAAEAVSSLRLAGIEHVVMLTGDNERVAGAIAADLGITEYRSGLLPHDKTAAIRQLKERYGYVAMVGDGINDAPALATADIGIAMGAAGSDSALEAADVALMSDDLAGLSAFLLLGGRTLRTIRQNVWVSVGVKLAVLVAAIAGYAHLWLAVFADSGVALLVILNGLRLLRPSRGE